MKWLVFLLFFTAAAHAQLSWDRKEIDLHPAISDTNAVARFTFKNVGTEAITISSVKPSCECCTVAANDRQTYKSGDTGEIKVTFSIGNRRGLQEKTIMVRSNAPGEPSALLTLKVQIPEMLKISPSAVTWNPGDKRVPRIITLSVPCEEKVHVRNVHSPDARIRVELREVREGREYQMIVTPLDFSQTVEAVLRIETDFPKEAPRRFSAFARILASR